MNSLPLMLARDESAWIISGSGALSQCQFLDSVYACAAVLPDQAYVILLANRRSDFLVSFCAAILRGQTVLLPLNDTDGAVAELVAQYPDCYAISSSQRALPIDCLNLQSIDCSAARSASSSEAVHIPAVPANHVAAILQTSGSTGHPQSHAKTWADLVAGARRLQARLSITATDTLVTTVPAQHMFGLETSVLLPLQSGAALIDEQPLFPADVAAALSCAKDNASLITTPLHLSACVRANQQWPSFRQVICSTAYLDPQLAGQCRKLMQVEVSEIYGSTETGAVATREANNEAPWTCLDGLTVNELNGCCVVMDEAADSSIRIADQLDVIDGSSFRLLGRSADMLKIAGKRMSMADLNVRLNRIDGVQDGVFFATPETSNEVTRLSAVVVTDDGTDPDIRAALAQQLDQVFLPRKIYYVASIPRSATGKLSDRALQSLITQLKTRE